MPSVRLRTAVVSSLVTVPEQSPIVSDGINDAVTTGKDLLKAAPASADRPSHVLGPLRTAVVPPLVTVPEQLPIRPDRVDDAVTVSHDDPISQVYRERGAQADCGRSFEDVAPIDLATQSIGRNSPLREQDRCASLRSSSSIFTTLAGAEATENHTERRTETLCNSYVRSYGEIIPV